MRAAKPKVVRVISIQSDDRQHDARGEAPVHVGAGDRADAVGVADRHGRRLVGRGRIAQRALDEEVHDGDGDVGEQQRRDRLVDAAIVAQPAGEADPDAADQHRRQRHDRQRRRHGGTPPVTSGMATAAAAKPPSTSAPSAADHGQADARRNGEGEAGEDQRRRALQRVLDREGTSRSRRSRSGRRTSIGDLAEHEQEEREDARADATSAPTGMTTASIMRDACTVEPRVAGTGWRRRYCTVIATRRLSDGPHRSAHRRRRAGALPLAGRQLHASPLEASGRREIAPSRPTDQVIEP